MSGRFTSRETTPSPPKSRSPKRRPLHQRSDSEINERKSHSQVRNRQQVTAVSQSDQENSKPATTPSFKLPKIYTTSPFPAFESQFLRPFPDAAAQLPSHAGSVTITPNHNPTQTRHATATTTTTTPVIIDHGASSRTHDSFLHDVSVRSSASSFRFPDFEPDEAGLVTPSSTIRVVDATPSPSSRYAAMTNFSLPNTARSRRSFYDEDYSPSISDLPSLSQNPRFQSAATPTPATRQTRPTVRAIANIQSDATQTPGSARSANSSGTQVHRRARASNDVLPRGSYLHFADKRIRRSTSDPELAGSSPVVQRLFDSVSPSPNVRRLYDSPSSPNVRRLADSPLSPSRLREQILHPGASRNFSSPATQQSDAIPDHFPARTRYVQAIAARSPSPTPHGLRSPRRRFVPVHNRWSSVDTTSDMRSMSMSPSEVSDLGALLEEPSTIESAFSVSIASAMPSIRLVEHSGTSPSSAVFDHTTPGSTPRREDRRFREDTEVPEATTNSPVWVSYSSPAMQLPYISGSQESLPTPEISRHHLQQISEPSSASLSEAPSSPNVQEVIFPANSSHDVRMPSMRRRSTMRQTSGPFFTPGSRNGHLRQSTIGTSPAHTPEQSYTFEFGFNPEPTQAATSAFQPSPDPSNISSLTPSEAATPEFNNGQSWGLYPTIPPPRSPLRPRIPFPVGASSANNSPTSIHIPRNRQSQRFPGPNITTTTATTNHTRNQTYGGHSPAHSSPRSSGSRRSSSPTVPSIDYRDTAEPASQPFTPPTHIARPSNPTPGTGVTPATTLRSPAPGLPDLSEHDDLPEIAPLRAPTRPRRPKTMSFLLSETSSDTGAGPSNAGVPGSEHNRMHVLNHKPAHRDLRVPNHSSPADWTPHLWHGASHTLNRRSAFIAPSINSASAPFLSGYKARRDMQVLLFMLGFLLPPCWLVASLLPLPGFGKVEGLGGMGGGRSERLVKGKSIIGGLDLEKEVQWTADEVAGFESARWWRRVNRFLSLLGLAVCVVLVVVGVVTSKGGLSGIEGTT